jgi:ubiquinone/menaquinone biosynthesis C-methylase UbiE
MNMAVTYMLELEQEPATYERYFTQLTKGINQEIFTWIQTRLSPGQKIMDVGCGPGTFARLLAEKGCHVVGVDSNPAMIEHNEKAIQQLKTLSISFRLGTANDLPNDLGTFDAITSTFMLSELRYFKQLQFLQSVWRILKDDGHLFIAEEFEPEGLAKIPFALRRKWYTLKLRNKHLGVTHPLQFLHNAFSTGFRVVDSKQWNGGALRVYELVKVPTENPIEYNPTPIDANTIRARWSDFRCLATGQIDHVPIEPGLYPIGSPNRNSPVIVTANYLLTVHRVLRSMQNQNCWMLVVDSNGINVWCAARGNEFGNSQVIEAVVATHLIDKVDTRTLILPQLAAGGVGIPDFPSGFPFKIKFGPVWASDLPKYLDQSPKIKPQSMKIAKFSVGKRLEAGFTHSTFLLRMSLLWPSIMALLLFTGFQWWIGISIIGQIWLTTFIVGMGIALLYPLTNFTRYFVLKGLLYAVIFGLLAIFVYGHLYNAIWIANPMQIIGIGLLTAWLSFFATMSFSGYTFETSYREIAAEYPQFARIHKLLLVIGLVTFFGALIWSWF